MSRANPFGDLDDFAADAAASRPVQADAIDLLAQASGFPSRKAQSAPSPAPARQPRRHTTGRNRQINIKATEEVITTLYRIADDMNLPLGAVLEEALTALNEMRKPPKIVDELLVRTGMLAWISIRYYTSIHLVSL